MSRNNLSAIWALILPCGLASGNAHMADYVPITAVGPGAERFTGFVENTSVFYHLLDFAKIDFQNPTEPLITETSPAAHEVEHIEEYKLA